MKAAPEGCMTISHLLARPEFDADDIGAWISADYLSAQLKAELAKELPKAMKADARSKFLSLVGEAVQHANEIYDPESLAKKKSDLTRLQTRARTVLQCLRGLTPDTRETLFTHAQALALKAQPETDLSNIGRQLAAGTYADFHGYLWDAVHDIETAAEYAASKIAPKKTNRAKKEFSKSLVCAVARQYLTMQGKLPPCSKNTWFPDFMCVLGGALDCQIGLALVASEVNGLRD